MPGRASTLSRSAARLSRFANKPRREQFEAIKATVRHYYRSLARRESLWQNDPTIRKLMAGRMAPPHVLRSKERVYVAYRPDSDVDFNAHPELPSLAEKWVWNNSINNAGDLPRLYALVLNVKQVLAEGVEGDFAELGVYRGNSAALLAHYARENGRTVFLFDTFEGFNGSDLKGIDSNKSSEFSDTSLDMVRGNVGQASIRYIKGHFPGSLTSELDGRRFAIVHLDCDLYEPTKAALEYFYPRLSPAGLIIMHDYSSGCWDGTKQAIDVFVAEVSENLILIPDKSGTAMLRKSRP